MPATQSALAAVAGATTRQRDRGGAMAFGRAEHDRDSSSVAGGGVLAVPPLFELRPVRTA
jgi:hypothetical protein